MISNTDGQSLFPLGMYEQPRTEEEWRVWSEAGINLLRCKSREELDRDHEHGMCGWVPVAMILADNDDGSSLVKRIESLRDHPALVAWEAPDEAIWNACRLETGKVTSRFWMEPPEVKAKVRARLEAVIRGLERGTDLVRQHDPDRKIWLNEACKSNQDILARCMPYLDIVGFDYYPIPQRIEEGRAMHLVGNYTDRFHRTAPTKDLWVVEQAFSWSNIRPRPDRPEAYPTLEEFRFMAWEAIAHGATGVLWWGSSHEDRPTSFLPGLMSVVAEFKDLHPFLLSGEIDRVCVRTDERQNPTIKGISRVVRCSGDRTLLALINEDPYPHDVMINGLDWVDSDDLSPIIKESASLKATPEGYFTHMEGSEVRIFLTN